MEKKEIVENNVKQESYHHCDIHKITLSGILDKDIFVRFISSSRTQIRYVIDYKTPTREFNFEGEFKYSVSSLYKDVIKDIEKIFEHLEIEISKEDKEVICKIFCGCASKCESRFGNSVKDFEKYWADAVVIIKGVDNGKPKYKITFFNHGWEKSNPEDYDVGELSGRAVYVNDVEDKNYVIWLIEKDSISFEDLLIHLMCEFDNPYLMIEPCKEMNIILDFNLKTDLYNVTM